MASEQAVGSGVSRRTVIILLVLVAIAALAALLLWKPAANDPGKGGPPREITLATFSKALGNAPYHVARRLKLFEQDPRLANVRFNYMEFNDRPAIASAFSAGKLDLLFSAEIPAILIRAQGEEVRIVAASTFARQEIIVPTASPVQSVPQLKGRRVGVLAGTSSHYALLKILADARLQPKDVDIVFMPAAEGATAFERGDLEGWAVWAPFVEIQQVAGRARVIPGSEAVINSVATMSNSLLQADPAITAALIETLDKSKKWIIDHPAEAQKIMSEDVGIDLAVVQKAWPKFHWDATIDEKMIADFEAKSRFLSEQKLTRDNTVVNIRRDMLRPNKP
jgi:sulfonate transport system substrate-binding protein